MKARLRWPWERRKNELHEELEAHLRAAIEDRRAQGETPEQARAEALRELGNLPIIQDVTHDQWAWGRCERLALDLRFALRQLRKTPGYTATVILTLTLAIGANTAIFGLFYALMLRSLPVARPQQIVQVRLQLGEAGRAPEEPGDMVSDKLYDIVAAHQQVFSGMCNWSSWPANLHDQDGTRPLQTAVVTGGCFQMLGLQAALGRLIIDADDRPGGTPEGYPIVLGYDYWKSHLGGDPSVLGRVLDLSTFMNKGVIKKGVVVGVMEAGFDSVQVGQRPWIYVPSEMADPLKGHNLGSMDHTLLARLKDGVTPQQAQAQIDAVFNAGLKAENFHYHVFSSGAFKETSQAHLLLAPGRTGYSYLRQTYRRPLYLMEGMVGLSLLTACAFLATLASMRALARRRELALRIALGASRGRIMTHLFFESLMVTLAGSLLGVLFAWAAERALLLLIHSPDGKTLPLQVAPNFIVFLFTLGLSLLSALFFGLWPAWRASRLDPATDVKEGETTMTRRGHSRLGAWLVPVQIAFSLVMVVTAALMSSTFVRLLSVNPGFRAAGVTAFSADFSSHIQHQTVPVALDTALLDRIRHAPGVESASMTMALPMGGGRYMRPASSVLPTGEIRKEELATSLAVMPGYFQTMGTTILSGRDFTFQDKGDAPPVCILNQAAADYFFPGRTAPGNMLTLEMNGKPTPVQVIAVVGNTLYADLREAPPRIVYQPYLGTFWNSFATVIVQARSTASATVAVRSAVRDLAPDVALGEPVAMTELVGATLSRERLVSALAAFFAVLTLALTVIGLYGLLSYSVVRRRNEIGIRMALGASRASVVRVVLGDATRLVLPGLFLGAAAAWGTTRLLRTFLFGVKPLDPWLCSAALALLLGAALLACVLPARRAASVQPMEALRFE